MPWNVLVTMMICCDDELASFVMLLWSLIDLLRSANTRRHRSPRHIHEHPQSRAKHGVLDSIAGKAQV